MKPTDCHNPIHPLSPFNPVSPTNPNSFYYHTESESKPMTKAEGTSALIVVSTVILLAFVFTTALVIQIKAYK